MNSLSRRSAAAGALLGALVACGEPVAPVSAVPGDSTVALEIPLTPSFAVTQQIKVGDLGVLGTGSTHVARAINNRSQVVGISTDADGNSHAFFWSEETSMLDLGTTGGKQAEAHAINDQGVIAGMSYDASGEPEAFRWSRWRGMESLGRFGGMEAVGLAVNNSGVVVGRYTPTFDPSDPSTFRGPQSFMWGRWSGFQELPSLGGTQGFAVDVNDAGQVVGMSTTSPTSGFSAFVWSAQDGIRDLGSMGASFSEHVAFSINQAGQVAGGALNDADGTFHPFTWTEGGGFTDLKDIGFPASASGSAIGVNMYGHLALVILEADGSRTPAVWVPGTGVVELPTLGGADGEIWAINDLGVIVGWSQNAKGAMRPAMWRIAFSSKDRVEDVQQAVADLLAAGQPRSIEHELEQAAHDIDQALDELNSSRVDVPDVINELRQAVADLNDAIDDGLDPILANALIETLVEAGRQLAVDAIDAAIAAGGDPRDIADAQDYLAAGDAERADGDYETALRRYRDAAREAERA